MVLQQLPLAAMTAGHLSVCVVYTLFMWLFKVLAWHTSLAPALFDSSSV